MESEELKITSFHACFNETQKILMKVRKFVEKHFIDIFGYGFHKGNLHLLGNECCRFTLIYEEILT